MSNNIKNKKAKNKNEDSIIINDDLFEQKGLFSDEDQIILNEEREGECSFLSNNINQEDNNNNVNNNQVIKTKLKEENKNKEKNEKKENIKFIKKKEIKSEENFPSLNNKETAKEIINNEQEKINEEKNGNNQKHLNYHSKKVIYKRKKSNKNINDNINNNKPEEKKIINKNTYNKISPTKNNKITKKVLTEKKQTSKKSYINDLREKKNIKMNHDNISKIYKNNGTNDDHSNSCYITEKTHMISKSEVSYDKYGNKTVIKKKQDNSNNNNKNIIIKTNKSYVQPTKIQFNNNFVSQSSSNSPKMSNKKMEFINRKANLNNENKVNKSTNFNKKSETKTSTDNSEKNGINAENLKKILMNKINNQINRIIKGKENMFLNENNKLFFLGFCDILFELGFLHIKETDINDISDIKNHINELHTQPYTNRALLCEDFLFTEQNLLICAWKTILNKFNLIKEFNSLPEEKEEISLDDCKLFIFIIVGLFIGYNNKCFNEENKLNSDRKFDKNKYSNDLREFNTVKDVNNELKLTQSYNKGLDMKNKNHIRKKSELIKNVNEDILKKILSERKKSDYDYKSVLKIKNFFSYFAELRKLYNLYQKELKNIIQKKDIEKDETFCPKTNKNKQKFINKFSPKMDFFQRSAHLKNKSEQKIVTLQKECSQKLLKECIFEPCKEKKNLNKKFDKLSPKQISDRLYYNNNNNSSNKNHATKIISFDVHQKLYEDNIINKSDTKDSNSNPKKIHSKMQLSPNVSTCKKVEKILYMNNNKEVYNFEPNINKKFNRHMFSKSPLDKDELVNKRIKDLRSANLSRSIQNYEKNNREILSNEVKNDENLVKKIIFEEKKSMKLDIEKKTYKDTFDNFQNYNEIPNHENVFYYKEIIEPLFTVEIKIKQNIKTIDVYQNNIPEKLAYEFCVENSLGKSSYDKIVNIIKAKLEKIINGKFPQNNANKNF